MINSTWIKWKIKPESDSKDSPQILERDFVFIGKVERQLNAKLECDSID